MGNSGIFLLMFPLSVYLVQQTCQAVSSTQQLPLDYRGILSDVVVGKIAAFGCCNVYLPTDRIALLEPVERCAGLDSGHLLFCEAIELVLPLRIAPLVGRFGQGAVPNCMEIAPDRRTVRERSCRPGRSSAPCASAGAGHRPSVSAFSGRVAPVPGRADRF